jgi:hypothetical protein
MDKVHIVIVGDGLQLPPVCRHSLDPVTKVCRMCPLPYCATLRRLHALGKLRVMEVPGNQRLNEAGSPRLAKFLRIVRDRVPTQQEIDALLKPFVVTREQMDADLDAAEFEPDVDHVITALNHVVDDVAHVLQTRLHSAGLLEGHLVDLTHTTGDEKIDKFLNDPKFVRVRLTFVFVLFTGL